MCVTSVVTGCVLETDTEDRAAGEVTTLVLTTESEGATGDVIWDVAAISVRRDSGGRSDVGSRVAVVKRGSVDAVLVGVGVDSVMCRVWGLLRAVLPVCVFPKLTSVVDVENVRTGMLTGRECGWVFPVVVKAAAALGVVVWAVLVTRREDGVILVWVADIPGCAWVEVGVAAAEPLFPADEEGRWAAMMVERPALGEDAGEEVSVSLVTALLGCEVEAAVDVLSVERLSEVVRSGVL